MGIPSWVRALFSSKRRLQKEIRSRTFSEKILTAEKWEELYRAIIPQENLTRGRPPWYILEKARTILREELESHQIIPVEEFIALVAGDIYDLSQKHTAVEEAIRRRLPLCRKLDEILFPS